MVICKTCGGPHPTWECSPEKARRYQPTAARKDVQVTEDPPLSGGVEPEPPLRAAGFVGAGTQAPPVGTKSDAARPGARSEVVTPSSGASVTSREAGDNALPAPSFDDVLGEVQRFDKRAYQREYMRKRRAALKAANASH